MPSLMYIHTQPTTPLPPLPIPCYDTCANHSAWTAWSSYASTEYPTKAYRIHYMALVSFHILTHYFISIRLNWISHLIPKNSLFSPPSTLQRDLSLLEIKHDWLVSFSVQITGSVLQSRLPICALCSARLFCTHNFPLLLDFCI